MVQKLKMKKNFFLKKAKAISSNGEFILLKGSIIPNQQYSSLEVLDKNNKYYKYQRKLFLKILSEQDERIRLNKFKKINKEELELLVDIKLNSPSEAKQLSCGSFTRDGWADWKNKDNKTLDDIYRK